MPEYLSPYWVMFENRSAGCVEDVSEEAAKAQAATLGKVTSFKKLPYPATPRLSAKKSDCPPFCYTPNQCQGRGSCPKGHACDD
jgi:hypothetical protein